MSSPSSDSFIDPRVSPVVDHYPKLILDQDHPPRRAGTHTRESDDLEVVGFEPSRVLETTVPAVEHEQLPERGGDDLDLAIVVDVGRVDGTLRAVGDKRARAAPRLPELPEDPARLVGGGQTVVVLFFGRDFEALGVLREVEDLRLKDPRRLQPQEIELAVPVQIDDERDSAVVAQRDLAHEPDFGIAVSLRDRRDVAPRDLHSRGGQYPDASKRNQTARCHSARLIIGGSRQREYAASPTVSRSPVRPGPPPAT